MAFATGKQSIAFCARCGFQCDYTELKNLVINQQITELRVCEECWEPDQPQYLVGRIPIYDPQALRDPNPDNTLIQSRGLFGWNPVGNMLTDGETSLGQVTVVIS